MLKRDYPELEVLPLLLHRESLSSLSFSNICRAERMRPRHKNREDQHHGRDSYVVRNGPADTEKGKALM